MILVTGAFGGSDEPASDTIDPYALEKASVFTYGSLIFISDAEDDGAIKELAPNVRVQETFDSIGGSDAVLINSDYAGSLDSEYLYSNINTLIGESHPVMLMGGDSPWIFTDKESSAVSTGFSDGKEDLFCLFYDSKTGISRGNSISGQDLQESLGIGYEWAEKSMDDYTTGGFYDPGLMYSGGTPWILNYVAETYDHRYADFGAVSAKTCYYVLQDSNTEKKYVLTVCELQGTPGSPVSYFDKWIAVADMTVSTEASDGAHLETYAPLSVSGIGIVDVDMMIGVSWSYKIPDDSAAHNQSNYATDKFAIWHDFNELGAYKAEKQLIKPGKVVSVNGKTGVFHSETEEYSVTFYKERTLFGNQFLTVDQAISVSLRDPAFE
ncbi:MAG: hypothetical protein LBJ20_04705 [Candidatus Methanoplasma sp.]|nr:hypothetical protein [Candidatus Methanoplasma sp.]